MYAAAGSYSGVGSRLSGMESREEAERLEEEGEEVEEEESLKELEPEEEEMAMAAGGLGWFLCYWLWEEGVFAVKKSRCRGRLNSEKVEDGSAVSHSTRSQL